jgi:hypothetical protein
VLGSEASVECCPVIQTANALRCQHAELHNQLQLSIFDSDHGTASLLADGSSFFLTVMKSPRIPEDPGTVVKSPRMPEDPGTVKSPAAAAADPGIPRALLRGY